MCDLLSDEDIQREVQAGIEAYGVRGYARLFKVDPAMISRVASGKRPPSRKFLRMMGLERVNRYQPIKGEKP